MSRTPSTAPAARYLHGYARRFRRADGAGAMPDRLPSLVLLVAFWIPPVLFGRAAADLVHRSVTRVRPALIYTVLAISVVAWAAAWFLVNLDRMPPYIPGATDDPATAPPEAVRGLLVVASALVLPGSAIACWLAFRGRGRSLERRQP